LRTLPLVVEQWGVIGLWAALRSPTRQRFGDRWANTFVVRGSRSRPVTVLATVAIVALTAAWVLAAVT